MENIITSEEARQIYRNKFEKLDKKFSVYGDMDKLYRVEINTLMANDYNFTKLGNFQVGNEEVITISKLRRRDKQNSANA